MKPEDWKELERLNKVGALKPLRGRGLELVEKTRQVEEHPDDYEGPCECRMCISYANDEHGMDY